MTIGDWSGCDTLKKVYKTLKVSCFFEGKTRFLNTVSSKLKIFYKVVFLEYLPLSWDQIEFDKSDHQIKGGHPVFVMDHPTALLCPRVHQASGGGSNGNDHLTPCTTDRFVGWSWTEQRELLSKAAPVQLPNFHSWFLNRNIGNNASHAFQLGIDFWM